MNEKKLTSDLVNSISASLGIPKIKCDDFLRAFFESIVNALVLDGIVKIKGLGTFKLIQVEERKSVNVQTGSDIFIPAHTKISFLPDKVLKEDINKPYAHLKTYVLNPNAPLDAPELDDEEDVVDDGVGIAPVLIKPQVEQVTNANQDSVNTTETLPSNEIKDHSAGLYDSWGLEYDSNNDANSNEVLKPVESVSNSELANGSDKDSIPVASLNVLENPAISEVLKEDKHENNSSVLTESSNQPIGSSDDAPVIVNVASESADILPNSVNNDVNDSNVTNIIEDKPEVENKPENEIKGDNPTDEQNISQEPEKAQHGKIIGVAIITFLILLGVVVYGILRIDPEFFNSWKVGQSEIIVPNDTTSLSEELSIYQRETTSDTINQQDSIPFPNTDNSEEVVEQSVKPSPYWSSEFVAYMKSNHPDVVLEDKGAAGEKVIKQGSRLTVMALDAYGDKSYWIYLYLYNTDRISNPNNINIGTKIRIPKLDATLVNGTYPQTIALANEVRREFVK